MITHAKEMNVKERLKEKQRDECQREGERETDGKDGPGAGSINLYRPIIHIFITAKSLKIFLEIGKIP